MKRYLKVDHFPRVAGDFAFLVKRVRGSRGELDFRLRDGYFNLYFKGNSLAKVSPRRDGYQVEIHHKFVPSGFFSPDRRFRGSGKRQGAYRVFRLRAKELKAFFQKKYIDQIGRNIARVNYGEEITFEHLLVTDNLDREDFIIIDRQVTDPSLRGRRMDLLALTRQNGNRFRFLIIEVKLGSNAELEGKVQEQLEAYTRHLEQHFDEWKDSYEETYRQMKALGLFDKPSSETVEIVGGVRGLICVGGYTGVARVAIQKLKRRYPRATVQLFKNRITLDLES